MRTRARKQFFIHVGYIKGEDYNSLCPVYGVGIINDSFDSSEEEWFHHYRTVNIKDTNKVLTGLELIFLELPKFKPKKFEERKMGILWLRFLKEINENVVDVPKEFLEDPEISQAVELAQECAYSVAELEAYDKFWDAISREKTFINDARREGITKGITIGENQAKKEIAKKLLSNGFDRQAIFNITGFFLEDI